MMDILISVMTLLLGFFIGWLARERYAEYAVNKMLSKMKDQAAYSDDVLNIDIEKNNGVYYVYNSKTSAFIVQVKSKEEMIDYFTEKYPDNVVMIRKEHLDMFDAA